MALNDGQQKAYKVIEKFLRSDDVFMCLSGAAGFGKSYLLNEVANDITGKIATKNSVLGVGSKVKGMRMTASTNKAASLLVNAQTIYKFLGLYIWKDYKNNETVLKQRKGYQVERDVAVVVDEASMLSTALMKKMEQMAPEFNLKFILSGDICQLLSVEESMDVFDQGYPLAELTEPRRQDKDSHLFRQCCTLRSAVEGNPGTIKTGSGVRVITRAQFDANMRRFDWNDTMVVSYMNTAAVACNKAVRAALGHGADWAIGDTVLTRTFHEPSGTPIEARLTIQSIAPEMLVYDCQVLPITFTNGVEALVSMNMNQVKRAIKEARSTADWDVVKQLSEHILDIRDAYSGTVHTAQGSSFGSVIIDWTDINKCWDRNTRDRLKYTAFTRARKQVYIIKD